MDVKSSIAGQPIPMQPIPMKSAFVPVWDPLVRVSHWLMAAAVLVDWITDEPRWMHVWLGYLVAALVVLRVVWGFLGPEHARFADFVTGPRAIIDYLSGLIRFKSRRCLGHSPAGGAMVIALLIMVSATAGTGIVNLAQDEGAGPLAAVIAKAERAPLVAGQRRRPLVIKRVHEALANVTLALVILHVCGVALASLAHKENLVAAMITGRKRA